MAEETPPNGGGPTSPPLSALEATALQPLSETLPVRLTKAQKNVLRAISKAHGVSEAAIVRRLIQRHLIERPGPSGGGHGPNCQHGKEPNVHH